LIFTKIPLFQIDDNFFPSQIIYISRDFKEQESAIEIKIIDSKNYKNPRIVERIDRAIDYRFFK
jgi:hypothetical protein